MFDTYRSPCCIIVHSGAIVLAKTVAGHYPMSITGLWGGPSGCLIQQSEGPDHAPCVVHGGTWIGDSPPKL